VSILSESELLKIIDALTQAPETQQYQDLSAIHMRPDDLGEFSDLDPFGQAYRNKVVAIYRRLSQRESYHPDEDEKSGMGAIKDIWRDSFPFAFKSTNLVSEFLIAWGAIFSAIDAQAGDSVLEYGPGSGQVLLMLARTSVNAFGVDIDQDGLDLLRRQSEAMGLNVNLERAGFGEGFGDARFDRILFFEAFHHALNFDQLLLRLHDRLKKGGRVVFAGEPVIIGQDDSIPYPWGPRMDALSVFCIRRNGWMELGFRQDFFVRLMMRCGWLVQFRGAPVYRGWTYIAEAMGGEINLGAPFILFDGWSEPEGHHRWTVVEHAGLPLPDRRFPVMKIAVEVANFLPTSKWVKIRAGDTIRSAEIHSGKTHLIDLGRTQNVSELLIETTLSRIPNDSRTLGIAVCRLFIAPTA
jgi:SAM-dependent methyltransferase